MTQSFGKLRSTTSAPIGGGEVEPRLAAWAYLSRVAMGPCAPLSALIEVVGVEEAARAVREWDLPNSLRQRTQARREVDNSARDLALIERLGGRLVTPDDPEWPSWRLLAFAKLDPAPCTLSAHLDGGEPLALWVLGHSSLIELTERAIAVVGARAASQYGVRVTEQMVGDIVDHGWTVVSGAAFGIDAAAHRAALACGGPTIAVLACGLDRPYPATHTRLVRQIAQRGLVVSEYPPGTSPVQARFLVRNRLVAALSEAVLVIEAGRRSGSRNTASWARRFGRPALAVPGSVLSAMSVGCHRMIAEGEAMLVADARELFDLLSPTET